MYDNYNGYNDETNNNENASYDYDEKQEKPWLKILIGVIAVIAIIIIIFLLLKACSGGETKADTKEDVLIEAAKEYYKKYEGELPSTVGECVTVTLETLLNENVVSKPALFDDCNKTNTFVTVCKSEDGYIYTPTLSCGEKIKYYYPEDETDESLVKEFYIKTPHPDYVLSDTETSGVAKWYLENSKESYYNGYASEAPNGYPNRGAEGTPIVKISLTKPEEKSYRTIKGPITLYSTRSKTVPTTCSNPTIEVVGTPVTETKQPYGFGYYCAREVKYCIGTDVVFVPFPNTCGSSQPDYKYTCGTAYTCNGTDRVDPTKPCSTTEKKCTTGKLSADGTKCVVETCSVVYGKWSDWSTSKCIGGTDVCKTTTGYTYTDKVWKWYQAAGRSYYPSGSPTADGEDTYYLEAPVEGAIKDTSTITTGYHYYKLAY